MKYHSSLTRQDIEDLGPSKIAQLIASEFWTASKRFEFHEEAMLSYHRARELMGVLETINFCPATAQKLAPFYRLCAYQRLFREDRIKPHVIHHFAACVARVFERASQELGHA